MIGRRVLSLIDRDKSAFVIGTFALQGAKLLLAFLGALYLKPEDFALWSIILLLLQYSAYVQLGATMGINRDLSILVGSNEIQKARKRTSATLLVVLLTTGLYSVLGVGKLELADIYVTIGVVLLMVLDSVVLFNQAVLRGLRRFKVVAIGVFLHAAGYTLVVIPALYWFASVHFILAVDVVLLGVVIYYFAQTQGWLSHSIGTGDVRATIWSGLPLAVAAGAYTLRQTSVQFIVLNRFDDHFFAGFSVSNIFIGMLYFFPRLTNLLWLPEFGMSYGEGGTDQLYRRCMSLLPKYAIVVACGSLLLGSASYVACVSMLDKYYDFRWLVSARVLSEGMAFSAIVLVMFLYTVRRTRIAIAANLLALLPYATLYMSFESSDVELTLAMGVSSIIYVGVIALGFLWVSKGNRASAQVGGQLDQKVDLASLTSRARRDKAGL